jgi:dUTPase
MFKSINGGKLPERATKYSAGFDVFANEDMVIGAGETKVIGLGICIDNDFFIDVSHGAMEQRRDWIMQDKGFLLDADEEQVKEIADEAWESFFEAHYIELHPRSSLRAKGLGGGVGIIDMDYKNEIKMIIHNPIRSKVREFESGLCERSMDITNNFEIKKGDKIGQLILKRHEGWLLPAEYTKDEERVGGFGSTDSSIDEKNVNASKMMGVIK